MRNFSDLVDAILEIINLTIPVIFAITLVVIVWKVTKAWIISGGDPNSIEEGKKTVLVAVIALTVMVSIWGIVRMLQSSLSLT